MKRLLLGNGLLGMVSRRQRCNMPSAPPFNIESIRDTYPFKSNWWEHNGLRYHYLDEGEGEVLLMLHGNPTWSFYYRELIKAFFCIFPIHITEGHNILVLDVAKVRTSHATNTDAGYVQFITGRSISQTTDCVTWNNCKSCSCSCCGSDKFSSGNTPAIFFAHNE